MNESRDTVDLRDVVIVGATVQTMDDTTGTVEALALRGGRVLAAGSVADVMAMSGPGALCVDVDGATVVPGLHDAHVHLGFHGLEALQGHLGGASSLDEVVDLLHRAEGSERTSSRARAGRSEWVLGSGFAVERWSDPVPHRAALDRAFPHRPVFLVSQDHHGAIANGEALRRAGIDPNAPAPAIAGGTVVADASGCPSGYLLESAVTAVRRFVPDPSDGELAEALRAGALDMARLGVTTVHHMAYEPVSYARTLAREASLDDFPVRVWACVPQEAIEDAERLGIVTGLGGDRFAIGGAKFFVDGALGSGTAWMLEPYENGGTGMALMDVATLSDRVAAALRAGLVPVTHAIGDAAVRATIDAYAAHEVAWRARGLTPRVEHVQHAHALDVQRMGALGLVASVQPLHLAFDAAVIAKRLSGREDRAFPLSSLLRAGAVLAFGSDTPVAPPDALRSMQVAVTRTGDEGHVIAPHEALTPREAVHASTVGAATAIGREHRSGRLVPGYDADLVILDGDPTTNLEAVPSVLTTVMAGRPTYGSWDRYAAVSSTP